MLVGDVFVSVVALAVARGLEVRATLEDCVSVMGDMTSTGLPTFKVKGFTLQFG